MVRRVLKTRKFLGAHSDCCAHSVLADAVTAVQKRVNERSFASYNPRKVHHPFRPPQKALAVCAVCRAAVCAFAIEGGDSSGNPSRAPVLQPRLKMSPCTTRSAAESIQSPSLRPFQFTRTTRRASLTALHALCVMDLTSMGSGSRRDGLPPFVPPLFFVRSSSGNPEGQFGANTDVMKERFTARIPMGRMGKPEEIAAAAVFLHSEESSFIPGIDLPVDGGVVAV